MQLDSQMVGITGVCALARSPALGDIKPDIWRASLPADVDRN